MDPNRLKQGEQIAGIGAIALFIVMFFDWFGKGGGGVSVSFDAWEAFKYIDVIFAITIVFIRYRG